MPHLKLVVRGVQVESVTTNLGTEDHGHVVEIAGEILELEIRRDNLRSNLIISRDKFEHCIGGQDGNKTFCCFSACNQAHFRFGHIHRF